MTNTTPDYSGDDTGTAKRMITPNLTFIDVNLVKFGDQIEVMAWHGIDGAIVVQVDTTPGPSRLRVIVNEGPIFEDVVIAEGDLK